MEIFLVINCFAVTCGFFFGGVGFLIFLWMDGYILSMTMMYIKNIYTEFSGLLHGREGQISPFRDTVKKTPFCSARRCFPTCFTRKGLFRLFLIISFFFFFNTYILICFYFSFFSFKYISNVMWCLFFNHKVYRVVQYVGQN